MVGVRLPPRFMEKAPWLLPLPMVRENGTGRSDYLLLRIQRLVRGGYRDLLSGRRRVVGGDETEGGSGRVGRSRRRKEGQPVGFETVILI